jgi:hypothetical protein
MIRHYFQHHDFGSIFGTDSSNDLFTALRDCPYQNRATLFWRPNHVVFAGIHDVVV